jgi:hypothetical protein
LEYESGSERGDERSRFCRLLALSVGSNNFLSSGKISEKPEALQHSPDHTLKIRLLVSSEKIGQVGDIVITTALDPLAEAAVIKSRSATVPELQNGKRPYELAVQLAARQF